MRHFGFVADPAKVRTPEHKGKVERSMPVVRQQLVAGRQYADLAQLNEATQSWCQEEIGTVCLGTTQEPPVLRFERDERCCLKPLPVAALANPTWSECKVPPDHHIIFERSYYSVPTTSRPQLNPAAIHDLACGNFIVKPPSILTAAFYLGWGAEATACCQPPYTLPA